MKCISCNEEISEKFVYALSQNVCPFCGKDIISREDHVFRTSLIAILKNRGIQDIAVINGIISDLIALINSEESEPVATNPDAPAMAVKIPTVEAPKDSSTPVVINGASEERVVVAKPVNTRPPKRLNFRSGSNDPISTRAFVPPSESMDMGDIESEIGGPTPEEVAEIQRQVDAGEIVFSTLG